jgi:pimeloyl-ACP methyl ester carboxylesterase
MMCGDRDPIAPIAFSETIATSLPKHLVRYETFSACGHGVVPDAPESAFSVLRDFILGTA